MRANKPDLYVNLTTGTYPSPFWLLYADSIWRSGEDHSFAGVGTNLQRWITYRDSQICRWVVEEGPLFPMSSLMLPGLIFARYAERLGNDPGHDFPDEVHSYFGTGTQLQEMYIPPLLLSSDDWDILAEAAKWSREKAIVTLRNPGDQPQDFTENLALLLKLAQGSTAPYAARRPSKSDDAAQSLQIPAQQQHTFHLRPSQVLTLDLLPSSL